jgi:hypothetical protein
MMGSPPEVSGSLRFAGQDHTTTTGKGMTSVVDRHRFHAEPDPKSVGKAEFFIAFTFIYTSAC